MTNINQLVTRHRVIVWSLTWMLVITAAVVASLPDSEEYLRVFSTYWASGEATNNGLNPFAQHPLTWVPAHGVVDLNLNPPTMLPLFQLFALFDPVAGARFFTAFSGLLYALCILILLRCPEFAAYRWQLMWLALAAPFANTLVLGQIYIVLLAFSVGAFIALREGNNFAAGICIGLIVAIKPNFAVWPAILLLSGHWRVPVIAALCALGAVGVSLMVYGPLVYANWIAVILNDGHLAVATDVSVRGFVSRLGAPHAGLPLSFLFLAFLAMCALRLRPYVVTASLIGILGSLLASPLAWFHYVLVAVPFMFALPLGRVGAFGCGLLAIPPCCRSSSTGKQMAPGHPPSECWAAAYIFTRSCCCSSRPCRLNAEA